MQAEGPRGASGIGPYFERGCLTAKAAMLHSVPGFNGAGFSVVAVLKSVSPQDTVGVLATFGAPVAASAYRFVAPVESGEDKHSAFPTSRTCRIERCSDNVTTPLDGSLSWATPAVPSSESRSNAKSGGHRDETAGHGTGDVRLSRGRQSSAGPNSRQLSACI